ncbi:MAG: biotin--[acetyl-CoA-carboxylase] ligase [candidate division Zixibacteria bacterium]|nr:biotin--[acetyl-CoA-carboxylase] ligase [candidate division Zixibacteria bacterium]
MKVYTDNTAFADQILPTESRHWFASKSTLKNNIKSLAEYLFRDKSFQESDINSQLLWKQMFIVESASRSQYDILIDLSQKNIRLEHGILCLAGRGQDFHGFRDRHWEAPAGNIYLSAYYSPCQPVENFGAGFMVLTAVSVIDTLDCIPEIQGKAMIKWVNDIFIDNSKICGVLAYTQAEGKKVAGVILGIGLNVKTTPEVKANPFVPKTASLVDFCPNREYCSRQYILGKLMESLDNNYRLLINGGYKTLLERYRQRSLAIGRKVDVCLDVPSPDIKIIANGRVTGIGDNLELYIEDFDRPVVRGRLILKN